MTQQYLLPKARNPLTGQTVKQQDLNGLRYGLHERRVCQQIADQLAATMQRKTGDEWLGFVEAYTPTYRR
jgi:hypothetical protein